MRSRLLLPLVPMLLAACGGDAAAPPPVRTALVEACVSRPEGSRWAGEYRATAVFGDTEDEGMTGVVLAGIAVTDSMVYVMESGRAALWLLRPDLSVVQRVGREGSGPGEWRPFGAVNQGGSMRWVHASPTGVQVFEGERIQEFAPDGQFRRVR